MLNKKGEMMIGTGVKVLIAVVVGATLLFGTHAIVSETVMPSANQKIVELFEATPQVQNATSETSNPETIYDNELIDNKYLGRLFVINKNLIEQKYGVSVAEDDVRWFLDGKEVKTGHYYATSGGNPIPDGTTVQAVISIQKGSIKDNPNCCTIITLFSE